MFNVFQYDREVFLSQQEEKVRRTQSVLGIRKKAINEILVKNYNYRVDKFLKKSLLNPEVKKEHIPPIINIVRKSEPERFLGSRNMIIKGFKHEKERIEKTVKDNSMLDTVPSNCSFKVDKKVGFLMRKKRNEEDKRFPVLKVDSDDGSGKSDEDNYVYFKENPEKLLENKGNKTHYKAILEKLVKSKYANRTVDKRDSVLSNAPSDNLEMLISLGENSSQKIKFLFRPLSLQVLESCNVVCGKRSLYLRKGGGHLVADANKV